jgi:hypothetical protein
MLDRVFNAPGDLFAHNISSHANREDVSQSLVEDPLDGYARITATENGHKRMLRLREFATPRHILISTVRVTRNESGITHFEGANGFFSGYRFFRKVLVRACSVAGKCEARSSEELQCATPIDRVKHDSYPSFLTT